MFAFSIPKLCLREERELFPFHQTLPENIFSLYKHVGSQVQLLLSLHTDAVLPGNPCLILPAEGHNGEKQWRVCLLLMIGYRVLNCMSNGAKIFWQRCHQSMVTAVNSCPWFIAEGTLVLVMLSCKIQMALSASTDQLEAGLLYLFVSWAWKFSHAAYHRVSHFRFWGKMKECRIKT